MIDTLTQYNFLQSMYQIVSNALFEVFAIITRLTLIKDTLCHRIYRHSQILLINFKKCINSTQTEVVILIPESVFHDLTLLTSFMLSHVILRKDQNLFTKVFILWRYCDNFYV